uniref:C-type lectin domain-containing protein n=1 Tax=Panagrolaimus davidi TaxID=227884 RepID=A0A914PMH6_9BILA
MNNNYFIFLLILSFTVFFTNAVKTCPEKYQTYANGNKCFSFLPSRAQWITAEQACQQNDGTLAKIESAFDLVFISTQADSFYGTYADNDVWIGLNNLMDINTYQWTDESIPKLAYWGTVHEMPKCIENGTEMAKGWDTGKSRPVSRGIPAGNGTGLEYYSRTFMRTLFLSFFDVDFLIQKRQPLTDGPYCASQTFKDGNKYEQYWSSESCFDFKFFVCEWNGNLTDTNCGGKNSTTTTASLPITTTTTTTTTALPTTTTLKPTVPNVPTIETTKLLTNAPTTAENVQTEAQTTNIPDREATTENDDYETSPPISNSNCDPGFTFNYYDGRCYQVFDVKSITDQDYEKGCRAIDGHLPSIQSNETNEFIFNLVANAPENLKDPNSFGISIGLQLNGSNWEWTDGSPKDFLFWVGGPTPLTDRTVIIVDKNDPTNHHWETTNHAQNVYAYVCSVLAKKIIFE